ncbi:MAG: type II toxin-antitoxin system prevent-host-death family antitoxin [Caldilineaceae bacterium]|nr:type II toxin-antitoxin system prevent-host-death family antitoxin [Caldilineaceae bacterium]
MSTKIMPVSDLRKQTSAVIQGIQRDRDVVYITQHGRPTAVLIDYEEYGALLAHNVREFGRVAGLDIEDWEAV